MPRALTLISTLAFCAPAFAQDGTEIAMEDVPDLVLDTAMNTAPGVDFDRVSIEVENGVAIYEFEAKDHNGCHIEIDVTEDGRLEEIEMEVSMEDVPEAVATTLQREAPGFRADYIELSVRDGGGVYVYEFEGDVDGAAVDIEIAENGELLVLSDDYSS
ncbi:PepSY-like domain-containing protein [Hyphococcus luteus]|uniref:PepSY domain-containing protein n=1 Tax=Hyphococcus luteus TaxID=2058213 RepID=A0A2S7JZW4_9PROT|nr:PepSY-like domain-containing protein [Marinicaulis flavus]PQA85738.1 hypothetical protein CW354_22700 [Marinicaulis flavus]